MAWLLDVKCPKCGMTKWTSMKSGEATCLNCGATFSLEYLKRSLSV